MIIFYDKISKRIIGTIDGRVHSPEQMKVSISTSDIDPSNVGKIIIGWTENEKNQRKQHNLHLWNDLIKVEKGEKKLFRSKVVLNANKKFILQKD